MPIHSAAGRPCGDAARAGKGAGRLPDATRRDGPSVRRSGAFVKDFGRYRRTCGVHQTTEGRQLAVTLHTFRAWFASAIRAEHDAGVAATLLGHAQRGTTDQSYTKFAAERLIAAVEAAAVANKSGGLRNSTAAGRRAQYRRAETRLTYPLVTNYNRSCA